MGPSKKTRRSTRGLTVGVIIATASVIGFTIAITLGLSGELGLRSFALGGGASDDDYRNVTLTDAQLECEKEAREEFGERLWIITLDSHSSRYEGNINRYKMFFNLDVYPERGKNTNIAVPYLLNCTVHGSRGFVTHFESLEYKDFKPQPQRKPEGNIFGF